jgi:hypothetical protein
MPKFTAKWDESRAFAVEVGRSMLHLDCELSACDLSACRDNIDVPVNAKIVLLVGAPQYPAKFQEEALCND